MRIGREPASLLQRHGGLRLERSASAIQSVPISAVYALDYDKAVLIRRNTPFSRLRRRLAGGYD